MYFMEPNQPQLVKSWYKISAHPNVTFMTLALPRPPSIPLSRNRYPKRPIVVLLETIGLTAEVWLTHATRIETKYLSVEVLQQQVIMYYYYYYFITAEAEIFTHGDLTSDIFSKTKKFAKLF